MEEDTMNEIDLPRKWSADEVNALCRRADKGDEGAVAELREVFNNAQLPGRGR